jgi:hypothetical protein
MKTASQLRFGGPSTSITTLRFGQYNRVAALAVMHNATEARMRMRFRFEVIAGVSLLHNELSCVPGRIKRLRVQISAVGLGFKVAHSVSADNDFSSAEKQAGPGSVATMFRHPRFLGTLGTAGAALWTSP